MSLQETGSATAAPRPDERVRHVAAWRRLMSRPELGAMLFLGVMVLIAVLFNNYIRRKATEAR